jgi:transcriptional regulator CtsR/flagellar hook assembly protein FlgD
MLVNASHDSRHMKHFTPLKRVWGKNMKKPISHILNHLFPKLPSVFFVLWVCLFCIITTSDVHATPNAPLSLAATSLTSTSVRLTWIDNSTDEYGFVIERKLGVNGGYVQLPAIGPNSTTYTDTGLLPNTNYYYRIRAYNTVWSGYSNEVSVTTRILAAPSALVATALSSMSVKLTWVDNSTDESGFTIERKIGSGGTYIQLSNYAAANAVMFTDTGLLPSTNYYYRIRAFNTGYSNYSNEVSITTPQLNAPSALAATALSATSVRLNWTDNSTDETGFVFERKIGLDGTYIQLTNYTTANAVTFTDTGLLPATTYYYRMRAFNTGYSAYSNEVIVTSGPLETPTALSSTALSSTSVRLNWTDNSTAESGFAIERKTGIGGSYVQLSNYAPANAVTLTDTGLLPSTNYYYRIRAFTATTYSAYSNEVTVTTAALNAPSALAGIALSSTSVKLTWTDNSTDESGFVIEQKVGAGGTYVQLGTFTAANAVTFTSTGLLPSTTYYYRIRAFNTGYSAYSNEISVTTAPLNAPSALAATVMSSTSVKLTWNDNSTDESGFVIERKTGAGGVYAALPGLGVNAVTFTDTGLLPSTIYYYRIRAFNTGYSAYSNEISVTTAPLNAPSALAATTLSPTSVKLTWVDNSTDETGFVIERKTGAEGVYAALPGLGANSITYTDTGLLSNTTYYYRIRAFNTGYSAYSNEVSIMTPALNAPSALGVTALSSTSVNLTWTDNSTDEAGFVVERKIGSGGIYTQLSSVAAANAVTYADNGLIPSTIYYYHIRSYNATGYSLYSNEVSITTPVLNAPSALAATIVSTASITLTWIDNSTDESGFAIERKIGADGTYVQLSGVGAANAVTYTDNTLMQSTTYYYRIRAFNTGYSAYSNVVTITTPPLNAPSALVATAISQGQIKLTWNDNTTYETSYYIERKIGVSGGYLVIDTVSANSTTYTDPSVPLSEMNNTSYRVRACDGVNYSAYSNEAGAAIITISNVLATAPVINTNTLSTSTIQFTIDSPANVSLKIIPEKLGPTGTPVYQATQTITTSGNYSFTWTGKDSAGMIVPDEAYLYTLDAVQGTSVGWYSPYPPSSGSVSFSIDGVYDAFRNQPLAINYTVGQPSRLSLYMNYPDKWPNLYIPILDNFLAKAGSNLFNWDGRDTSAKIAPSTGSVTYSLTALRDNVIITTGDTPLISDVTVDPYAVTLSYGEFARISYTISRDANVAITLVPTSGGTSLQLTPSPLLQAAGLHQLDWYGLDSSDTSAKKFIVSTEGLYTVVIQVVNPVTGTSSIARASLKIGF